MTHKRETKIKSNYDDLELGVTVMTPDPAQPPKGILQIVHGMAEHRRRYEDFMRYVARQGYVVVIHDHRGHGDSIRSDDDLGYFYQGGATAMIEDAHQVTQYIKAEYPGLPLVLLGHSMGSLVARCYMKKYDFEVNGLVVCGSPSRNLAVRAGRMLVRLLTIVKGERHRSKLVSDLLNRNFSQRFPNEGSENAWIVSDPAVVAAYDADEKSGFTFTLNGYEALLSLSLMTYSRKGWERQNLAAPILFIAGADDPCIISAQDFAKAVDFMREVGYADVKSKLYSEMRHEILNEKGKQQVWEDVVKFCAHARRK